MRSAYRQIQERKGRSYPLHIDARWEELLRVVGGLEPFVSDAAGLATALGRAGAEAPSMLAPGVDFAFIRDPDGNKLEAVYQKSMAGEGGAS